MKTSRVMRNAILFGLLGFAVLMAVGCGQSREYSTATFSNEVPNLSFLDELVKDKKIIALGEASHGFGDMQRLKVDIVKYLHKKHNFDVLMMEAGYGDINSAWQFIDDTDPLQLMRGTLFGNMQSDQMLTLFQYLKEQSTTDHKLEFAGYDPQLSGKSFDYKLMYIVKRLEPKIIQDSIRNGFSSYAKMFQFRDNNEVWKAQQDRLYASIDLAKSILDSNEEDILEGELATRKELDILNHTLVTLREVVDYPFGRATTTGLALRDSMMAANILMQMNGEYKDKKVLIWGHNGHIERSSIVDDIDWMGHYLSDKFGSDYYSLGIFARKGQIMTQWNNKVSDFDLSDTTFIEYKLNQEYKKNVFVSLPQYTSNNKWYNQETSGYEIESGGVVKFIPTQRFDGLMVMNETGAPTFKYRANQERR